MKRVIMAVCLVFVSLTGAYAGEIAKCVKKAENLGPFIRDSLELQLKEMKKMGYSEEAIKEYCDLVIGK